MLHRARAAPVAPRRWGSPQTSQEQKAMLKRQSAECDPACTRHFQWDNTRNKQRQQAIRP
jgi:hypothetical protein